MTRIFAGSEHPIKTNLRVYLSPLAPSARRRPGTGKDENPYVRAGVRHSPHIQAPQLHEMRVDNLLKAYSSLVKAEIR